MGNVVEVLDIKPEDEDEEDGAAVDLDSQRKGKCVVLKTTTRQTIFLPVVGLVDPVSLKPGDLVGVNKDSYLILDTLPAEYDSRVKAMEVDEKPTEDYSDVGGLDKQIQELVEAVVLPIQHKDRFKALGIRPPKGVLLYGPPGTGKTLIARAVAAQTNATFLKLAGPQLVQMFIGDGAKMVRDAFALAKEKSPCIIFIDEIDAIGTKRFDSELSGDREVQRTMLELLNQLDGFSSAEDVKVRASALHGMSSPCGRLGCMRLGACMHACVRACLAQLTQAAAFLSPPLVAAGDCSNQPRRHPGPRPASVRPPGQEDRVPPPERGRSRQGERREIE